MRFKNLFKKFPAQVEQPSETTYELLFCDNLERYKRHVKQRSAYPWGILFSENASNDDLQLLINDPHTESRVKLLAYRKIMSAKQQIHRKELLGIIVEVGLNHGNDVLASFRDGTARYINQNGNITIWEIRDVRSDMLTSELFYESEIIIKQIWPWEKQIRLPPPAKGLARISFLMSDGLYFGQGPMNDLFNDPLARPALNAATLLMQHIESGVRGQNTELRSQESEVRIN